MDRRNTLLPRHERGDRAVVFGVEAGRPDLRQGSLNLAAPARVLGHRVRPRRRDLVDRVVGVPVEQRLTGGVHDSRPEQVQLAKPRRPPVGQARRLTSLEDVPPTEYAEENAEPGSQVGGRSRSEARGAWRIPMSPPPRAQAQARAARASYREVGSPRSVVGLAPVGLAVTRSPPSD